MEWEREKKVGDGEVKLRGVEFGGGNDGGRFMNFDFEGKEERGEEMGFVYRKMEVGVGIGN